MSNKLKYALKYGNYLYCEKEIFLLKLYTVRNRGRTYVYCYNFY